MVAPCVDLTATALSRASDRVGAAALGVSEATDRLRGAIGTRDEERATRELDARTVQLRAALDELARVQHQRAVAVAHDPTTWGQR